MARGAYRAVDQRPDPVSKFNLGVLMEERGDVAAAERAYRHADSRGHAAGAVNLGVLLEGRGDVAGAEAAYRRAQKRGDPNGAFNLGVLLDERGDVNGAMRAYRFADQRGHAAAACNLGAILAEHGDVSGAEAAFKRANERGDSNAAFNLAALLGASQYPEHAPDRSLDVDPPLPGRDFPGVLPTATSRADTTPADGAGFVRPESHANTPREPRSRRGAFTGRRLGLVLVPALFLVAAALVLGSSLIGGPKETVNSAAATHPTRPANTVATVAATHAAPRTVPPSATLTARHRPARSAHAKSVAHTRRPSSASTRHIARPRHLAAPPPAPRTIQPTYVASRGGSSGTVSPAPSTPAPSRPAPSTPAPGHSSPSTSSGGDSGSAPSTGTGTSSNRSSGTGTGIVSGGTGGTSHSGTVSGGG